MEICSRRNSLKVEYGCLWGLGREKRSAWETIVLKLFSIIFLYVPILLKTKTKLSFTSPSSNHLSLALYSLSTSSLMKNLTVYDDLLFTTVFLVPSRWMNNRTNPQLNHDAILFSTWDRSYANVTQRIGNKVTQGLEQKVIRNSVNLTNESNKYTLYCHHRVSG